MVNYAKFCALFCGRRHVQPQMIVQSISGLGHVIYHTQPIEFITKSKSIYYFISMTNDWWLSLAQWAYCGIVSAPLSISKNKKLEQRHIPKNGPTFS